jgi:hypothetical protein
MTAIEQSASYVRNLESVRRPGEERQLLQQLAKDVTPPEALVRIWELLETPQTIETICRVLTHEFDLPPATSTEDVKIVLSRLYRDDLIQVSPDT